MKKTYFSGLAVLMALFIFTSAQAQGLTGLDKESHQKYLYIFDPACESSLTKRIAREGMYDFSVLLKPKTEPAEERYEVPLAISNIAASEGASASAADGKILISIPMFSEDKKIILTADGLNIDTSIYPNFELIYNSRFPLDISLYFFVDINNDDEVNFVGYFGRKPTQNIIGGLPAYEFDYYIKHNVDEPQKNIKTPLYNELRLHRTDRIFFKVKKIIAVINGTDHPTRADISVFSLYNLEPVSKSVFLTSYEKAKAANPHIGSLLDFVESSPDFEAAFSAPLCEYQGNILKSESLDKETLSGLLAGRKEVNLGRFDLRQGQEFSLRVLDNDYFMLEAAYLAEDYVLAVKDPVLTFEKINPTRYIVDVKASGSFWLTLNENFHSGWKAYITPSGTSAGEERFALEFAFKNKNNLILIEDHRVVNAYANGWFVPVDDIFGEDKPVEFRVIMEFYPQRLYEAGMIVSGVAFAVMTLVLVILGLKKLIKRKRA